MNSDPTIRVMCVDDHPLVRKGVAAILANESDLELVAEACNGQEAVEKFHQLRPDVVLMDLRMPEMDGTQATRAIRHADPDARIIALTSYAGDQDIIRALEAGVSGYLLKEMAHTEMVGAIRAVISGRMMIPAKVAARISQHPGQAQLTSREMEVLSLVARGLSNIEIGRQLGNANGTVKMHIQNILKKLGASDRTHAVTMAIERGILHLNL